MVSSNIILIGQGNIDVKKESLDTLVNIFEECLTKILKS